MKKITSFFSKRSLAEQSSSEPPCKQPIINQREDSDENSDNGSGLASDSSSSYDRSGIGSRSGTGTLTMISKFANLAKRRAEDLVWNRNIKLSFTIYGLQ